MQGKKIISLTLASFMLFGQSSFALEMNNDMKGIKAVPISMEITSENEAGVIPAKEMQSEGELVHYNVKIPKVEGLNNSAYQKQINDIIMNRAMEDIENVEMQAEELSAKAQAENWEWRPFDIVIDFQVRSSGNILSFIVNSYSYTGGANGITRVDCYNIDTVQNENIALKDLFKENTDYKNIINKQISAQIEEQKKLEEKTYFEGEEGFTTISDLQDYCIEGSDLVIIFPKYSIAPGYMGIIEFTIPLESLKGMLKNPEYWEIDSTNQESGAIKSPYFSPFSGTVKEIKDFAGDEGSKIVLLENQEGVLANFIISDHTYILDEDEIRVGSNITGYFKTDAPILMIYPAQYNAEVITADDSEQNVKVDIFDKEYISSDKSLKLNISDDTEIFSREGEKFEGNLANKKLIVTYDISTKSIPAQTVPTKIIVLGEDTSAGRQTQTEKFSNESLLNIIVRNEKIKAPSAYIDENSTIMVPLRAIAEALGFEVKWNGDTQSVMIGEDISFSVDKDRYMDMKNSPIELGTVPALVEGTTYVPLEFFPRVMGMSNVFAEEGRIVIDNVE